MTRIGYECGKNPNGGGSMMIRAFLTAAAVLAFASCAIAEQTVALKANKSNLRMWDVDNGIPNRFVANPLCRDMPTPVRARRESSPPIMNPSLRITDVDGGIPQRFVANPPRSAPVRASAAPARPLSAALKSVRVD